MSPTLSWVLLALGAYLIGSVPFGLLIGKARGVDVRQAGSRNIGATNVGRVLGKPWGFLCFGLDFGKGAAPVLAAGWLQGVLGVRALSAAEASLWLGVAVAALLGHMFPLYLKFKGGKGVATGFGVMLATYPGVTVPAVLALALWLGVLAATRYVSLSSCVAACSLPVSLVVLGIMGWPAPVANGWGPVLPYLAVTLVLAALVVWKHRANIGRLRAGTEPRVGRRNAAGSARA